MSQKAAVDDDPMSSVIKAFEERGPQLFRYADNLVRRMRIQGVYSADDILGEVALIACQKAVTNPEAIPQHPKAAVAWLMRTALFVSLNHFRKARTERKHAEQYETIVQEHELRSAIEEDRKLLNQVRTFAENLDYSERDFLEKSFTSGFTSAEMAKHLGISPAAVRTRKARLLTRLRAYLMR